MIYHYVGGSWVGRAGVVEEQQQLLPGSLNSLILRLDLDKQQTYIIKAHPLDLVAQH